MYLKNVFHPVYVQKQKENFKDKKENPVKKVRLQTLRKPSSHHGCAAAVKYETNHA